MREIIARLVCIVSICAVVALSLRFASVHNPTERSATRIVAMPPAPAIAPGKAPAVEPAAGPEPKPETMVTPAALQRGRNVYEQQRCATCHSIAGEGNPRNPLDDAGTKHDATALEEWITGAGKAAEVLPPSIAKRKQRYRALPREEIDALVAYLSTLRSAKP